MKGLDKDTVVTHESSMAEYERLMKDPPEGPEVPFKELRPEFYSVDGRSVVTLVRSRSREEGILEGLRAMGGVGRLVDGVDGEVLLKPNCNTDDPYPRDTHPDTIRVIAQALIDEGFPAGRIVVGETSGRARGLPTRHTLENLGVKAVVDEMGLQVSCFEEGEWVTVRPPKSLVWPEGIKIPRKVYEAERVILTPILRPHSTATFTMSLKLAVGMLDSLGREWLHDGIDHVEKLVELNLAYSADLVIADATQVITGRGPRLRNEADTGVIIVGSNRVATDAVGVALLKLNWAAGISTMPVLSQKQLVIGERLGLGSPRCGNIDLMSLNLAGDEFYEDVFRGIIQELGGVLENRH